MTFLEIYDVVVKGLTFISVGMAAFTIFQSSRSNRRQWHVGVFTTYTKRYECIMESFPKNAYRLRFDFYSNVPPSEELSLAVLKYLNLISEEFYLWREHYIDDKLWKIWEKEIKRTLRSPVVIREWKELKHEFEAFPEFCKFVNLSQAEADLIFRNSTKR